MTTLEIKRTLEITQDYQGHLSVTLRCIKYDTVLAIGKEVYYCMA
jgi:hypothetical protein